MDTLKEEYPERGVSERIVLLFIIHMNIHKEYPYPYPYPPFISDFPSLKTPFSSGIFQPAMLYPYPHNNVGIAII